MDSADHFLTKRTRHHIASLIDFGILHSESPRNHRHFGLRLRERNVRLKTPQNMNEKRGAIRHSRLRALAERRVYVSLAIQPKPCGRDSDDRVRFSLEDNLLLEPFWTSAETAPTPTVTYYPAAS